MAGATESTSQSPYLDGGGGVSLTESPYLCLLVSVNVCVRSGTLCANVSVNVCAYGGVNVCAYGGVNVCA